LDNTVWGRSMHVQISGEDGLKRLQSKKSTIVQRFANHFGNQERLSDRKAKHMYSILTKIAALSSLSLTKATSLDDNDVNDRQINKAALFQGMVSKYFLLNDTSSAADEMQQSIPEEDTITIPQFLKATIPKTDHRNLISLISDIRRLWHEPSLKPSKEQERSLAPYLRFSSRCCLEYTARAASKIFHGLDSPRARAKDWYSHYLWGRWREVDFDGLYESVLGILKDDQSFS